MTATSTQAPAILRKVATETWESIQVYPSVIAAGGGKDYRAQALSQLKKLGVNALRLVAERAAIAYDPGADASQLAAAILAADSDRTVLYLAEFIRQKGKAINEEWESRFSKKAKDRLDENLKAVSKGRTGGLKLFAKLLFLFEDDANSLSRIFLRKLWRDKKTTCEFVSDVKASDALTKKLEERVESLASSMSGVLDGFDIRFFGAETIDGWRMMILQREYAPTVRPDFRDTQKTLHGLGWMLIGLKKGDHRVILKGGGQKAIEAFQVWFKQQLKGDLLDTHSQVYSTYDAHELEDSLLV